MRSMTIEIAGHRDSGDVNVTRGDAGAMAERAVPADDEEAAERAVPPRHAMRSHEKTRGRRLLRPCSERLSQYSHSTCLHRNLRNTQRSCSRQKRSSCRNKRLSKKYELRLNRHPLLRRLWLLSQCQ